MKYINQYIHGTNIKSVDPDQIRDFILCWHESYFQTCADLEGGSQVAIIFIHRYTSTASPHLLSRSNCCETASRGPSVKYVDTELKKNQASMEISGSKHAIYKQVVKGRVTV